MIKLKKQNLIILCIALLVFILTGCSSNTNNSAKEGDQEQSLSIQQIAYKSLNANEKLDLVDDKVKGTVESIVVTKNMGVLTDETYYGKEVYAVTFLSKTQQLGDITVFVDGAKQKVIGRGYRE